MLQINLVLTILVGEPPQQYMIKATRGSPITRTYTAQSQGCSVVYAVSRVMRDSYKNTKTSRYKAVKAIQISRELH
jgi:hypothetical protein